MEFKFTEDRIKRMDTVLAYYINMNLDVTDGIKITEDDIYTVWYAEEYISDNLLKNPTSSVRLASTTLPDGKYYLQQYNSYDNIFTHMYVKNRNSVVDLNSDNIDKSFKETCYSIILKDADEIKLDNIDIEDMSILFSVKTLQNWKMVAMANESYLYEFTYNGDKEELYVDRYQLFSVKSPLSIPE